MTPTAITWLIFNIYVLAMLALDLGVFHRNTHTVSVREALIWSAIWIIQSLIFNAGIYYFMGKEPALQFLTGYLIEKSLSGDNLFVFLLIFSYFNVKQDLQHRVLFWGVLGALVMRAILIALGSALVKRFDWVMYIFGAFLVFTAIKMLFDDDPEIDPEDNPVVKLVRKLFPVTPQYHGSSFFVRIDGKRMATPLVIVVAVIEVSDLVFAVDSIPAIFSITDNAFIIYTSNVFAILGLRSLYFALAGVIEKFRFLNYGLAFVLAFVGIKMLIVNWLKIPTGIALGVVGGALFLSGILSAVFPEEKSPEENSPKEDSPEEDSSEEKKSTSPKANK